MQPGKLQSLLKEALGHHRGGRLVEAERLYARARQAAPASFDALHLSGVLAHQQGRFSDAAALLRRAVKANAKSALAEMRLGLACAALGEFAEAEGHYRAALMLDANLAEAWCNLGVTLRALSRASQAQAAYEQALSLKPDYAEAHDRLGALVSEIQGFAAAVPHLRRAVELQPQSSAAWANLGVALAQSSAAPAALECFSRALAADPRNLLALTGRALVHQESGRVQEAIDGYGAVLMAQPRHHEARSGRLLALHYLDGVKREDVFAEHQEFGNFASPATPTPPLANDRTPDRRLRVAFLSPDLRAHSVAYFLEPLLAQLDREQFEIFLYHDHPRVDAMSERLRAHAATWRHFAGQSNAAVETTIRADAPDILVDLAGHTGLNRLPLFARRLAPVQVTYLGYPDTTGLQEMDYRLVDGVTDPVGEADALHTEKLVRFAPTAWSYVPPATAPDVPALPSASGSAVRFGCFNNFAKVNDGTLRAWARILAAVPGSRLVLKGHGLDGAAMSAAVRQRFAAAGGDPAQLDLLGRTSGMADHLALYGRMDIALDTFPYHGTTTTCEALWMGRPVITLAGDRHASRVGASLLGAVGRNEWVTQEWDGYVEAAVALARDPARLAEANAALRAQVKGSPLMDHAGQAKRFGAALREGWRAWCGKCL